MTFVEEVKNKVDSRARTEEFIKEAVRKKILDYTKMVGWPHARAHFGGIDLQYLLLSSGWSQAESIDDLRFYEVIEAVDFIVHFLRNEDFKVETECDSYGINFVITWEKN